MNRLPPLELAPIVLTGAHVRLEPLLDAHLDGIMRAGEDESIWQWLPYCPRTRAEYEHWLNDALAAMGSGTQLPFATIDVRTGEVVGSTRLFVTSRDDRRIEIGGTWLAPQAQRTAINTESKYLLLRHCFETLRTVRVELKTDARNEKSQQAIERIGARRAARGARVSCASTCSRGATSIATVSTSASSTTNGRRRSGGSRRMLSR